MDKKCLECLINRPRIDSLNINLSLQVNMFKEIVSKNETQITDLKTLNTTNQEKIVSLEHKVKRLKSQTKIAAVAGVLLGFVTATVVR